MFFLFPGLAVVPYGKNLRDERAGKTLKVIIYKITNNKYKCKFKKYLAFFEVNNLN